VRVLVAVWILGVVLGVCLAALGVALKLLRDARAESDRLQATVGSQLVEARSPRSVPTAGRVVGKVVEAATRARDQGVGRMVLSSLEDFTRWAAEQRSEKYRGLIVKTQGDGHMVVFTTPRLALDSALDIQRAFGAKWNHSRELRRTPIRVRIGLHTGTAIERSGDYLGQNVALAARVAAQADGGEVLVTGEIAEACADDFAFARAASVQLKGFEGEHALWHVERAAS
jgi:class 3 adenylate cyclase